MYHRMYTVFHNFDRLPQEIGSYSAIKHLRVDQYIHDRMPEHQRSNANFKNMQNYLFDAQIQLESDGLMQRHTWLNLT